MSEQPPPIAECAPLPAPDTSHLVDRLEKLLAGVKDGSIIAIAVAFEYRLGGVDFCWNLAQYARPSNLLGAVTRLQLRLAQHENERDQRESMDPEL